MAIEIKKGKCLGKEGKFPYCEKDNVPLISSRGHCYVCSNKWKLSSKKSSGKRISIKKYSSKQEKLNALYNVSASQYKKDHAKCEVNIFGVCTIKTNDIHHKAGRGKYLLDQRTWIASCRSCHNWIHENPKESREKGLLV